jgi:hypothetical protein
MFKEHRLEDQLIILVGGRGTRWRSLCVDKNRNIQVVFVSDVVKMDLNEGTNVVGGEVRQKARLCFPTSLVQILRI